MSLTDLLETAKSTGDYNAILDAVPYSKFLGLRVAKSADELITTMHYAPHLIGNPRLPALHGGTLGALLESAAIFELLYRSETTLLPKTITITIDYLRSGLAQDTYATAIISRQGRRVANVRAFAWQADRSSPVAIAHAIFMVMRDE